MASLATAWSPSSFQLRLAFQSRRTSPTILVRTRSRKLDCRIRLCAAAQEAARGGSADGAELRRAGESWMGTNASGDAFLGWSGSDGAGPSREYQRKQWLTEILGATVAGVILFAGLTFATLSLAKRNTSRPKQQMEPLTTQEEVSAYKSQSKDAQNNENGYSDQGSKTGIDRNSSSSQQLNSVSDVSGIGGGVVASSVLNGNLNSNPIEGTNNESLQKDLEQKLEEVDVSVASDASIHSHEIPNNEASNGSSMLTGSNVDLTEGEFKAKPVDFGVGDLSLSDMSDVTPSKEQSSGLMGGENSEFLLDSSSDSADRILDEPLNVNVSVSHKLDAVLEPQALSKGDINVIATDFELKNAQEAASAETLTTRVAVSTTPLANEQMMNGEDEIYKSGKSYDSTKPQKSFFSVGIPAPSVVSAALQIPPGKFLVPAAVDQVQWQALKALQVLKVIEADVQPSDLCTRREYARWLVSASSALSRSAVSKVYPAMYIENVSELAYDDVTPEDPDFSSIQGLAEAGLISSKLSRRDMLSSSIEDYDPFCFSPDCPLSRQDLVSWKVALEKRHLPEADRKILYQLSGFIDIDKINPDAWPAIMADLSLGDQGITALAFGYTKLFQPDKPVTKAQAAIALATGEASDIVSEELARIEADSMAKNAVAAHNALVAQVERDINASFEKELAMEREKIRAVEKLAEEARQELEKLKTHRLEERVTLMKEHAAVESEMEVFSRLRHEVQQQLQSLMNNKVEMSYEKERISKLRKDVESENQQIARLHFELDVERKALSMARAWAEDEARRAREQAKAIEEARDRWERQGIKVIVDRDLQEEASAGVTWLNAGKQHSVEGTISRAENLVDQLKAMAADVRGKSKDIINMIIQKILSVISSLREWMSSINGRTGELKDAAVLKFSKSANRLQQSASDISLSIKEGTKRVTGDCREGVENLKEGAKRVAGDCRDGVEKLTQRFKM